MTEQLMDDLSNEEHEALLLISEHAIAPPLSPAAKAVLAELLRSWQADPFEIDVPAVAAAIRTAALFCKRDAAILLSIADELEALANV